MKRVLMAFGVLLGPAATLATAEYMLIKLDVNKLPPPLTPSQLGSNMARPGGGPPPVAAQADAKDEEPPLWITAYVELSQKSRMPNYHLYGIDHPWGKAYVPDSLEKLGTIKFYRQDPVKALFADRKRRLERDEKSPEKLLRLAQWAVDHGLTASRPGRPVPFLEIMNELAKLEPKSKEVQAVAKVTELMEKPVASNDPLAEELVRQLEAENYQKMISKEGHYVLYTNLRLAGQSEVEMKKWAERLEDNYRSFYYWFAARGTALRVPTYRLVAVVVAGVRDFDQKHETYGQGPTMADVADGFLVRRANVAIFSNEPLDLAYEKLQENNRQEWGAFGLGRDELLSGDIVKKTQFAKFPMVVAKFQTLALIQKAVEKERGRAAATHEGTRQLMAASGLLPRGVMAAQWAHSGLASFLETPAHAFYLGAGLPHWIYLVEFKHLQKTGKLAARDKLLLDTLSDRYFEAAHHVQQQLEAAKDNREPLETALEAKLMMARTTAWALTYYLARNRPLELEKYYRELSNLPRDLQYGEDVLQACFARAFGLETATGSGKLDADKLKAFADAWYAALDSVSLDLLEFQNDALTERASGHLPPGPAPTGVSNNNPPNTGNQQTPDFAPKRK
jgi:hypothetical protein